MDRKFASTELYALENNALAIETAISVLKSRLRDAPGPVANDVLRRCNSETHSELMDWIRKKCDPQGGRPPKNWSPRCNTGVWLLYHAANLECPPDPPRRGMSI